MHLNHFEVPNSDFWPKKATSGLKNSDFWVENYFPYEYIENHCISSQQFPHAVNTQM